ncbi:hypothetical protein [Pseudoalteromonas sp. MMG005]|uniref:hypothetical protein n=1 Tax=Pseudoalteromonas sp. MMG005 TaxID=2822682 RepID=UPI001B39FE9F|nr:hypothetical protein [Pseudoalteromonas sp. MMG005]MBQ4845785.1 hypothetical protein [Pseudoalteromonas sp. MMG005]
MHSAVLHAITSLLNEGKTPTVALTKARLSEPVAMPLIIAGIAAYKNNPKCINEVTHTKQNDTVQSNDNQLDRIEKKLDLLLSLLEKN